jgi:glycosyltransferase involved in cell wall biosynthesis
LAAIKTNFHKLCDQPLVYVIASGWGFGAGIAKCLKDANGRKAHILVQAFWHVPDTSKAAVYFKHQAKRQFANLNLIYLCPTENDTVFMRGLGLQALHAHHNAFIDEKIYRPDRSILKIYSAIHIANLSPFKRHHLAWKISNLALVTYAPSGHDGYGEIDGYQNLAYCNYNIDAGLNVLDRHQVRDLICASRCGIILSEKEGGNFASTEYQLCGVPVVSTPSLGGRDEFFDAQTSKIVEPDAVAVGRAVQDWIAAPPDPWFIRNRVIEKMKQHRRRLLDWLESVGAEDVYASVDENLWSPLFTDKLRQETEVEQAITLWHPPKWRRVLSHNVKWFKL